MIIKNAEFTISAVGPKQYPTDNFETALRFVKDWQDEDTAKSIVVPDTERFAQQPRNISISTDKVTAVSLGEIAFTETLEGLKRFVRENHLSE